MSELMNREGVVYGMSEDEYHGHGEFEQFRLAEFSSSGAKAILKSAAHYDWEYNKGNSKRTRAMDIGTATHALVLEGRDVTAPWPDDMLTASGRRSTGKDAQSWIAEQEAAGLIIVSEDELKAITTMADNIRLHPDCGPALEQAGSPEVSCFGVCPETGLPLRSRFDFMPDDHHVALDLKTAMDASLKGFTRAIEDRQYDVQYGHYMDLAEIVGIDHIKDMLFIAVENVPPYNVNVIQLNQDWKDMGHVRAYAARRRLIQSLESGVWPGYPAGVKTASPPPWAVNRYQDELSEEMDAMR
ncbi:PD-(D/E)XK nuclease-like domain-containing protein [Leucobacter sp. cx-42]|uniref:PD-(D/E)XK nuclease-like domain-containing protein n=1 Tax=unclassified Leucobacter TaxID=2621730 RepID=UPI00165D593D|nr:PD-(D/E)XK nuclease-like domain-containing protein [Leucobacter sp. cx-42]